MLLSSCIKGQLTRADKVRAEGIGQVCSNDGIDQASLQARKGESRDYQLRSREQRG